MNYFIANILFRFFKIVSLVNFYLIEDYQNYIVLVELKYYNIYIYTYIYVCMNVIGFF